MDNLYSSLLSSIHFKNSKNGKRNELYFNQKNALKLQPPITISLKLFHKGIA
jgi:hypothetical protein